MLVARQQRRRWAGHQQRDASGHGRGSCRHCRPATALCSGGNEDTDVDSDGGGTRNQQSTKSSDGNDDGNGNDISNNDDDGNKGDAICGSVVAVAARRWRLGGGVGSSSAVVAVRRLRRRPAWWWRQLGGSAYSVAVAAPAQMSSNRACAQDGYFKCPHPTILDDDKRSDSGWFCVGF